MHGSVDEDQVRPAAPQSVDRAPAAVGGAVVDDHEHALCLAVGRDRHELLDQLIERLDPVLGGAAVEDLRPAGIPGGQVAERSLALVLVLDLLPVPGPDGQRRVLARPRLDRWLLVSAHHEVARFQQLALEAALVEVEDRAGLLLEVRVAREVPRVVVPRTDRVLGQPAPYRRPGDLRDDPALDRLAGDLSA
jgi:hypothetical protein